MAHPSERRARRFAFRAVMFFAALGGWLLIPAFAQTPPPSPYLEDDLRHLIGIQRRMATSLNELDNYTCRMEIRRAHLDVEERGDIAKQAAKLRPNEDPGARSFTAPLDTSDVVDLEVAVVDRKELYAFPDSARFEDRPLEEMIGHGTLSTGSFSGHARNIFVNGAGITKYFGEELLEGQPVRRYDYSVSWASSGFSITRQGHTATVSYHGSFWASVDNDELRRLTIIVDDIPVFIGIEQTVTQIDYQTLELNSRRFIVPRQARLAMLLDTGVESVNETEYSDCRSFASESTLSFDDTLSDTVVERVEVEEIEVPAGLRLPVRLKTSIDSETARVGTLVQAELTEDVHFGANSVLPKGALLSGRLRRFEFRQGAADHYVVGIEFREVTFDSGRKRAEIVTSLQQIANTDGVQREAPGATIRTDASSGNGVSDQSTVTRTTIETYTEQELPGVGTFYVHGSRLRIKPGHRMVWTTVDP